MNRFIAVLVAAAFGFSAIPALAQSKAEEKRESPAAKAREAKAKEERTESRAEKKAERTAKKERRKARKDMKGGSKKK